METQKGKTVKSKMKRPLTIIAVILASLILLGVCVYIAVNIFLNSIGRVDPNAEYGSNDPAVAFYGKEPVETVPVNEQAEELFADREVINILLVGQDRRAWDEEGPQRTDAMMLCTINREAKSVTMTSFLPDIWVYIPGLYNQRLNMPYKLGGFPLLNDTLEYNFGIRADYNIEIDFMGFMKAIDLVGGVEIQLTAAEAEYLNRRGNWGIITEPKWQLREGLNLLSGSQTLAYTRIEELGTDFARVDRQSAVMRALADKLKHISPTDLFDLSREVFPMLCTDMTNNQIIELLLQILPMLSELNIKSQHIPVDGQFLYEKKGESDVLVLNKEQLDQTKRLLREAIRGK